MKALFASLGVLILFLFVSTPVQALEFKSGESIDIATSSGSLVATGRSVIVRGDVNGDLFCAGQHVTIEGDIDGDVICAGQSITIRGRVNGDVRIAGQDVHLIGAEVSRNITGFAQDLTLDDLTAVRGEVNVAAQRFEHAGIVGGGIMGAAQNVVINGGVIGDVKLDVESLTLGQKATVSGNLRYESNQDATMASTATVSGTINKTVPPVTERKEQITQKDDDRFNAGELIAKIIFYSLIGIALVRLFPVFSVKITDLLETQPLKSFGFGILSLFVIPIILVVFTITIVGIPVAILFGFLWLALLFMSRIFVSLIIGKWLLNRFQKEKADSWNWIVITGVVVSAIIFQLPGVGGLLSCLAVLYGFGAFLLTLPWFQPKTVKTSAKKITH